MKNLKTFENFSSEEFDVDITNQDDKSFFIKDAKRLNYENNGTYYEYEEGDVIKVKDGNEIKEVIIKNRFQRPYKNLGSAHNDTNGLIPKTIKYEIEEL